jgi:hypothetical protein
MDNTVITGTENIPVGTGTASAKKYRYEYDNIEKRKKLTFSYTGKF